MTIELKEKEILETGRKLCESSFVTGLTKLNPMAVFLGTAILWIQLTIGFFMCLKLNLLFAVGGFILICVCQQGMQLWTHEGSHYNLFKNHRLNDLWTDFFFSTPLGVTVEKYRSHHLTHHAHLATSGDLERWQFSENLAQNKLPKLILKALLGYYGFKTALIYINNNKDLKRFQIDRFLMTIFWNSLIFLACYFSSRWYCYFLVWVLPIFTISPCINILRTTSEHQPMGFKGTFQDISTTAIARTTKPNFFQKWVMYQTNFNYHVEHHLYPNIPFYNLPALNKHLEIKDFYKIHPGCLQKNCFDSLIKLNSQKQ